VSFINEHRERFGVEPICDTLQVAPSTYYAAVSRPPSVRQARDGELKVEISRVRQENFDVYGTEKVWKQLRRESIEVGRDRVGRLMAELKLEGAVRGKTWRTTIPSSVASRPADLVDRDFSATAPNRLWVADLTYVSTWPGVVYTAFVTALEGADLKVDLAAMPRIIFTTPTVAAAGLRRIGDGNLVTKHDRPQGSGPSLRPRCPVPRHSLHRAPRRRWRRLLGRVSR